MTAKTQPARKTGGMPSILSVEDKRLDSLKTMAALSGVDMQVKEICDRWILITYDLPHTEEGDKARVKFLKEASLIGAMMHTESVYLMPWTPESELMALELAEIGNAYLWLSSAKGVDESSEINKDLTSSYDVRVADLLVKVHKRIVQMQEHVSAGNISAAERMREKTDRLLNATASIVARRGSVELSEQVGRLREKADAAAPDLFKTLADLV